jgi:DegV family protein with EDD domain
MLHPITWEQVMSGTTAVVTDSTSDLPPALAAQAGIRVVPLYVQFGSEEFQAGVDLSTEMFWTRLLAPDAPFPTTASPSPGTFRETYEACFAAGADAIVCLTIGTRLSSTYQAATVAAQALPDREVHVIDTATTSMSTGIAALLATELAASGMPAAEIAAAVKDRLRDIDLLVAVDTLEYLRRGGRLSAARAAIGTVLAVKPIITVRDGEVVAAESPRTRAKARARIVELATAQPLERLAILHTPTSTPEEVEAFRGAIVSQVPGGIDPARVSVSLIGASTGPHLGPDLMGAAFLRRR